MQWEPVWLHVCSVVFRLKAHIHSIAYGVLTFDSSPIHKTETLTKGDWYSIVLKLLYIVYFSVDANFLWFFEGLCVRYFNILMHL